VPKGFTLNNLNSSPHSAGSGDSQDKEPSFAYTALTCWYF